ncbi:hypothetical protein KY358_02750 [Candidatus Woesearchaeota archaeon]|nr:hypothetical protein [Candidatus Woesearchaeota archaeon]
MFDFVWKVKESFRKVKSDVTGLRENVNDWIIFLDGKDTEIEKRLDRIEARIERLEETMLRALSLR